MFLLITSLWKSEKELEKVYKSYFSLKNIDKVGSKVKT